MKWLVGFLALLAVCVLPAGFCYWKVFFVPRDQDDRSYRLPKGEQYEGTRDLMLSLIHEWESIPCERVRIRACDGTILAAKYYHVQEGAPLQIQFHGYHGSAMRDFCGGNKLAREMGFNTLAVDQRAHGKSGGHTTTFGIRERRDCLSWVRWACERFGPQTPIFLAGVSMGASTVLMATELELPPNVVAILADCPYSSPEAIIRKVCRDDLKLPPNLVMPFVKLGARLFGHFDLCAASAVEAVRHTKIPILLLHGEADRFVPCEMSWEIFEACAGEVVRETFPEAGHGLSYVADTNRYAWVVRRFMERFI